MPLKVGTRYLCSSCHSEFIVIKGAEGSLTCCGKPMEEKQKETK